jgi:hypothetical protein
VQDLLGERAADGRGADHDRRADVGNDLSKTDRGVRAPPFLVYQPEAISRS